MAKLKPEDIALNNKIAIRIKELRTKVDSNQKRFAENNDLERQTLNRWESINDKRGVSVHTINRFCKILDISLKDFFDSDSFKNL
ncbi:helix-turn-helix transcriptional regulator [Flagellimonas pacifica]|uniref:DNA-binding transcriptional regulator, XRE-family HTH domain n=1 Tax=Flagellimonas pacifica TaxID=1247520 RepID=A0A285MWZ4_9FLAO|nr:helix-turn-helix transcriptional regulator [Allomuricauda parva]SNZ01719.1 DNA-binding transcriptional regulator, XRE-family HTH domain [Allomuricauda parva]